ncbi:MAG: YfhO family protein [Clostridia bacterium]|nr:YfhO family protein [Clostridia bacterium]
MKKKLFNKYNGMLLCAFCLPSFLMLLHYFAMEVWPVGNSSVLVLDLNGQYVYFFEALRDIILDGKSLIYTWSRALGGEFMGIFAYYLASPFSIIVALFPEGCITEALLTIFVLKAGSCGLTMAFYLSKTQKSDNIRTVTVSTMYALCSYAIVQAHNTMWIDALIYLPVITYAIEQLVNKRRIILYIAILALTLTSNYYIGYMVCIYCVLYFLYYFVAHSENKENNFYYERFHFLKSFLRFAASSIISAAMSAWVLYPAYYSLTFGKTEFSDPTFYPELKFQPLDFISKLFFGSYDTVEPSGLPFVYCGTLMLILLPVYFFSKRISARKKIAGGVFLSLFVAFFTISTLDIAWHGFQAPNWLNYRYSFMFIFLALVFTHRALADLEKTNFNKVAISAFSVIMIFFIIQKIGYDHLATSAVIGTVCSVIVLVIALYLVKKDTLWRAGSLILCLVVCLELFSSAILHTQDLDEDVVISSRSSYNTFIDRLTPIVNEVYASDAGFYRFEKNFHRKRNDNFTLGLRGLSNSTSTLNASQIELLQKMGFTAKSHWSKYIGQTPVTDALFGIKYIISEESLDPLFYNFYKEDTENDLLAYQNPYALSIAYGVNKDILDISIKERYNPFLLMNDTVTAMLGEEQTVELFKQLPIENIKPSNIGTSYVENHKKLYALNDSSEARITYTVTALNTDPVYMYIPSEWPMEATVTVNGEDKGEYFGTDSHCIKELGDFCEGETVDIRITLGSDEKIYVRDAYEEYFYYLDSALFAEIMPKLRASEYTVLTHSDTKLSGTVKIAEGDNILFTTIPYDEGWQVEIDGKKAEPIKTLDSLLAFEISQGDHTVEFLYRPDAVVKGVIFSALGTVMFAALVIIDTGKRRKRAKSYRNLVDITR